MINLHTKKLGLSSLGASMVIAGVVVKNTHEQTKSTDVMIPMIGTGLFLLGWVIIAFSCSLNNIGKPKLTSMRSIITIISIVLIISAVMVMKGKLPIQIPKPVLAGLFGLGWIVFGYSLGLKNYGSKMIEFNENTMAGLIGSSMVILSMRVVLPWQRINNVVDGPGMPLFVAGWVAVILGNSMR